MRNFLLGILFVLLVGAIGFAAYQLGQTWNLKTDRRLAVTPTMSQTSPTPTPMATMTPVPSVVPPTVTPTVQTQSDTELIRTALFAENNWPPNDTLKVTISTNDGTYASGMAGGEGGGGYVFAKKVNGNWEIVADGNGVITCTQMAKYPDFPKNLIPECYDEISETNVKR